MHSPRKAGNYDRHDVPLSHGYGYGYGSYRTAPLSGEFCPAGEGVQCVLDGSRSKARLVCICIGFTS